MTPEQTAKLFHAGRALLAWRDAHQLSDDDIKRVICAVGWPHLVAGYQQSRAGSVTTAKKARASAANGKLGGRPRKTT